MTRCRPAPRDNITYIHSLADIAPAGVDIIINLAGAPIAQRWTATAKKSITDSRLATTDAIIAYIQQAAKKPELLISASAIGYYGTSEHKAFNEDTPPEPVPLFSAQLCAQWENSARQAAQHAVRTVLLRIGVVLEKDGGVLKKLLLPFRLGLGGQLGSGKQWFSWIDRDDLIKLVLFIIDNGDVTGPVNATAPYPVTNKAFTASLAHALRRPAILPAPAQVLKLAYGDMADEIMLQGQKVLPTKALEHGFEFDYPSIDKSLNKILR
ncbi:MAG: TIGR01777 family protein [Acinetobacter sp.]|nr:TIGR01777 family protein [Acinetobacter sp.]